MKSAKIQKTYLQATKRDKGKKENISEKKGNCSGAISKVVVLFHIHFHQLTRIRKAGHKSKMFNALSW